MQLHKELEGRLRDHKLRVTAARLAVLQAFVKSVGALSHADLESTLGQQFDRVTLYRTLHNFEVCGLIHKAFDDSNTDKFALCSTVCEPDHHRHEHLHFQCRKCNTTYCLEEVPLPAFNLPIGFKLENLQLLGKGICADCAQHMG